MNKNDDIQQKAIDEYVGEWRDHHPSILKIREKEAEYKMLKDQYNDAYKTYIKAMKKGSNLNYTLKDGQNVPGVQELIDKNKVRYVRINHNYQYLHVNELQVFDENGNNVAENSIKKKVYVSVTVDDGKWDSTRKWAWICFRDGNRDVTKRYWLWGRNFRRGSDINFILPVNFSNNGIDGMSFYIGNDGTRIKRIRVWILNEQTNRWEQIVDKNHSSKKHTGDKITPLRCYKDRGSRALRYGPHRYGYTAEKCRDACPSYKYFALQAGNGTTGWCSCDNDWRHVTKYGAKNCGRTGNGWGNFVYRNNHVEKPSKWYKNTWDQVKFKRISFERDPNKPDAYASSEGWRGEANKIIDGEHSWRSWWPDANSNHTYAREKEYIELDLKKEHTVKKIRIWNRPDCCRWRLWNAEMVLLNEARQQVGEKINLAANRVKDYPIRLDNQPKEGRLARAFRRWIGMKECNRLCAEDEECETALYRPQTWTKDNGWSWGNQCIHYDKTVKDTENMPLPDYQYTAYNKPVWETENNMNYGKGQLTRNDDNDHFKFLGKKDSLASCKNASVESEEGPYDSVIYYSDDVKAREWRKGCYASVMGSSKNKQEMEGVYTAIPPGGQTGVITEEYRHSLEDVIYLNKKLTKLADEITSLHGKLYKAGEQYDSKLKNLNFSLENKKLKELQDLEKDRKDLLKMRKDLNSLNSEQDNYDFILTTNQYQYIALTIVALALLGFTIHQINKIKKE